VTAYVLDKSRATSGGRGAPRQDRIWDVRSLLASKCRGGGISSMNKEFVRETDFCSPPSAQAKNMSSYAFISTHVLILALEHSSG
jgi:hypothetical protein